MFNLRYVQHYAVYAKCLPFDITDALTNLIGVAICTYVATYLHHLHVVFLSLS